MSENKRKIRHKRVRKKVKGTKVKPRLCVFRSNRHIYAQLIDDEEGVVLESASDFDIEKEKANKTKKAEMVGELIAKKAQDKDIKKIVFDRAGYKYHGRVKALAEGARKEGLKF